MSFINSYECPIQTTKEWLEKEMEKQGNLIQINMLHDLPHNRKKL